MIEIVRFVNSKAATIGKLSYGDFSCFTVERPWHKNQPFVSCIPEGEYEIKRRNSPRFGDNQWEVSGVVGRSHILFHVANLPSELAGCIGLGERVHGDLGGVGSSRAAIESFYRKTQGSLVIGIKIFTGSI